MLLAFNKPYGVLSQFTRETASQRTLAEFGFPPSVYPLGRLDQDSEGLLLLSDEAGLNARLLQPGRKHWRCYHVQVEGEPDEGALGRLREGVAVQGRLTLPASVCRLETKTDLPPRDPPIRMRQNIPTSWLEIQLCEGRNRQVRRMTAAVGVPTLRLLRVAIGRFQLPAELSAGTWRELTAQERRLVFA